MDDPGTDYDVAIIGGGPAGAAMGCYLGKAGVKCVVFERAVFPRRAAHRDPRGRRGSPLPGPRGVGRGPRRLHRSRAQRLGPFGARQAHEPRARGAPAHRGEQDQRGDRERAAQQRSHRGFAPAEDHGEARYPPGGGPGGARPAPRDNVAGVRGVSRERRGEGFLSPGPTGVCAQACFFAAAASAAFLFFVSTPERGVSGADRRGTSIVGRAPGRASTRRHCSSSRSSASGFRSKTGMVASTTRA